MPEFCTCGARLPEDARFCHKCGKPQREELVVLEAEPLPPELPPSLPPQSLPIGFDNPVAVWIALRVAVTAFLLSIVTGILMIVWFIAGGFLCVYLYRRRTGERLSSRSGAHLGWLAGVFVFVLFTVLFTWFQVELTNPQAVTELVEQFRKALPESDAKTTVDLLRAPSGIAATLLFMFTLFTLLPALGGWLGARFLQGNRSTTDQRHT